MEERAFTHASFNKFLSEGRLMGSRCMRCGEVHLPPRPMCPHCFGTAMDWHPFNGEGKLAGFTVVHVGLPVMTAEGYSREKPYVSGVVRLAEGPAISAQIVGAEPDALRVGMEMQAVFVERGSGLASSEEKHPVALGFTPLNSV